MCESDDDDDDDDDDTVEMEVGTNGAASATLDSLAPDVRALLEASPTKVAAADALVSSSATAGAGAPAAATGLASSPLRPKQFFALRWTGVVTDNSNELLWAYAATPILALSE
jgi:hypothetical protein